MKCRRIADFNNERNVVWFGSYGKNEDGTAKFYNENDKHDNYSDNIDATRDSLIQRLSVLKRELWYNINYGMPLVDKVKTKITIDSFVIQTVTTHHDVLAIESFESSVDVNTYKYNCKMVIESKFGSLELQI